MITDPFGAAGGGDPFTATGHGLTLGSLDLLGQIPQGGYTIEVLGDDATWGSPKPITVAMQGLVRQGARVALEGWENREVFLRVTVRASTGDGLADGEAALFREMGRRNELTWTPPAKFSAPTVFVVEWAELEHEFDDLEEVEGERTYGIRLVCRPFARSVDRWVSEVMSAPPAVEAAAPIVVDAGTSTTGWAASYYGVVSTTGTSVRGTWDSPSSGVSAGAGTVGTYHLARNPDFSMAGTQYLRVEWSASTRADHVWRDLSLTINGAHITESQVAYQDRSTTGVRVWWVLVGTGTITQVGVLGTLVRTTIQPSPGPVAIKPGWLEVHDISRADQIVVTGGTGHQVSHTLMVPGAAPTHLSIHAWDDTDDDLGLTDLGDVMVYTGPKDGMLSLEPFRVMGDATEMGGMVSGYGKDLDGPVVYDIPAHLFDPERSTGRVLVGRLNNSGSSSLDVTVQAIVGQYGGTAIPHGPQQQLRVSPTTGLDLVSLGAYTVPPERVDGLDAGVRVTLYPNGPVGTPILDDVWMVDVEAGSLTWNNKVDDVTYGHLWIVPASVDQEYPRIKIGAGPNGVVGWEAEPMSFGEHEAPAGEVFLAVVSTGAPVTKVQVECDVNWHTHARTLT